MAPHTEHGLSDGPCRATTVHGILFVGGGVRVTVTPVVVLDASIRRAGLLDWAYRSRLVHIFAMTCEGQSDLNQIGYADHKPMVRML